jgi:hypothetical protein
MIFQAAYRADKSLAHHGDNTMALVGWGGNAMFDSILFEAGMNSCEFRGCYVTLDQFYCGDHC